MLLACPQITQVRGATSKPVKEERTSQGGPEQCQLLLQTLELFKEEGMGAQDSTSEL